MDENNILVDSNQHFFSELSDQLRAQPGADIALAQILAQRLLQSNATGSAVQLAMDDIRSLAASRAASSEPPHVK